MTSGPSGSPQVSAASAMPDGPVHMCIGCGALASRVPALIVVPFSCAFVETSRAWPLGARAALDEAQRRIAEYVIAFSDAMTRIAHGEVFGVRTQRQKLARAFLADDIRTLAAHQQRGHSELARARAE